MLDSSTDDGTDIGANIGSARVERTQIAPAETDAASQPAGATTDAVSSSVRNKEPIGAVEAAAYPTSRIHVDESDPRWPQETLQSDILERLRFLNPRGATIALHVTVEGDGRASDVQVAASSLIADEPVQSSFQHTAIEIAQNHAYPLVDGVIATRRVEVEFDTSTRRPAQDRRLRPLVFPNREPPPDRDR